MIDIPKGISKEWEEIFKKEFAKDYIRSLYAFLEKEKLSDKILYPKEEDRFNAFKRTPLKNIKCVIIGQDPYHNEGQATGLSFSVPSGVRPPPSLKNIQKELANNMNISTPNHGDLSKWSDEGVLLLNASLTVESGNPGSHLKLGWIHFTKAILSAINEQCDRVVFLSWGSFAHDLTLDIDHTKHHVIKTTHPSPLGARKSSKSAPAFLGSQCFKKTNDWLIKNKKQPISWKID